MKTTHIFASLFSSVLVACGGSQGTQPHDMSQEQHEAAAQQEEKAAGEHGQQYHPEATVEKEECAKGRVCWTSRSNPTEEHKKAAEQHRELAAKHRAAAAALAQAEATACSGIDDEDRDMSPFAHREDIVSATPIAEEVGRGKQRPNEIKGATVVFRAVPGLTAEWLQRLVDCHIARASSVGHQMPEMAYCPLVLKGVKATVSSTGNGFAIAVTSDEKATAEEILKRAKAAAPPQSAPAK